MLSVSCVDFDSVEHRETFKEKANHLKLFIHKIILINILIKRYGPYGGLGDMDDSESKAEKFLLEPTIHSRRDMINE